jgi:hypothetical protein
MSSAECKICAIELLGRYCNSKEERKVIFTNLPPDSIAQATRSTRLASLRDSMSINFNALDWHLTVLKRACCCRYASCRCYEVSKNIYGRLTDDQASHKQSRSESAKVAAQSYRESLPFRQFSGRFITSALMATLAARIATIIQICLKVTVCNHPCKCICATHSATLHTWFRFLVK